jgi:hypothetical protein
LFENFAIIENNENYQRVEKIKHTGSNESSNEKFYFLFISAELLSIPWESLPFFSGLSVTRITTTSSFFCRIHEIGLLSSLKTENDQLIQSPSLFQHLPSHPLLIPDCELNTIKNYKSFFQINKELSISQYSVSFLLNPDNSLQKWEDDFIKFRNEVFPEWKYGVVGRVPEKSEICKFLQNSDIFIYCGHNSGEQYYSEKNIIQHRYFFFVIW